MKEMRSFGQLREALLSMGERCRLAVVCPRDTDSREAVQTAVEAGIAEPMIFDNDDHAEACRQAVAAVRRGEADVLMKGQVNTDVLLRAILDKQEGLLPSGRVMTHVACAEWPAEEAMHGGREQKRLLFFTDPAVIPYPSDEQRLAQVEYMVSVCRSIGINEPRIALVHCTEKVSEKTFPFLASYRLLKQQAAAGCFGPCIVDGPLDLKTSLSAAALKKKRLLSPLEGRADALVFADIEAGNVFYKTITLFGCATAGMLVGPCAPVVLPSRGDTTTSKLASIVLAEIFKVKGGDALDS
ncbi:MAG: phosphate butyryltransferase [Prevotella sp.]|nr:phosphate butyryltransferase [Prevotella sp.]